MRRYRNHTGSLALALLTHLAAAVTVLALGFLVGYVLIRGVPNLNADMFSLAYTSDNQSMLPAILNTCTMTLLALLAAVPFGIASAIYLAEYAKKGSKIVALIRVTTETLSGIPSIVYGLFGMLFFSGKLRFGYSMLSGALTLALHMYKQASEGLYTEQAYATSVILLTLVLLINFCSSRIAKLMMKGRE